MALPQGINFRGSSGFVTDGPNEDNDIDSTVTYPRTSAQGNTIGYEDVSSGITTKNRNASLDPRIAGDHFMGSSGVSTYRIDLPSSGSYNVRLGCGDTSLALPVYTELFDTTSSLGVLANNSGPGFNTSVDATNTVYSTAAWPGSNTAVAKTFTTTICRIKNGDGLNPTAIQHFYIESAGGGSTVSGAGASSGTGAATGVGASTAASPYSSSGVGTATGVGRSTAASVYASSGVGAATSVGSSIIAAIFSSSGIGAATGVGDVAGNINSGAGSSSGTGTATGVGGSIFAGIYSSSGIGSATATGIVTAAAVYSSTGIGTATAVGHDANAVALKNMLFSLDYRFETYSLVNRQQQYALGNRSMLFTLLS